MSSKTSPNTSVVALSNMRQLERRLTASLEWLNNNIDRFSPREGGELSEAGIKALAELAIAYAWLEDCRSRASPLAGLSPLQKSFELWRALALRPSGHRSAYHEDTLRLLRRWRYPAVTETVPYRVLDRQYFLWKFGSLKREPNWRKLYQTTTLARTRCIAHLNREDAYSVTHTLFYLTDFGNRPLPLDDYEKTRIKEIVEALLIHYWRTSYWDLVGELLINLECLKMTNSVCYRGASNAFQRAWLEDGAVPPHPIESEADSDDPKSNDKGPAAAVASFWRHYHTTLVGALYCALTKSLQQSDGANTQETAAVAGDRPVRDRLAGRIRTASRRAQRWLGSAATPSPETVALRKFGILLCERISTGLAPPLGGSALEVKFPNPEDFVVLPRDEVLRLAQSASVSAPAAMRGRNGRAVWSKIFGGLALSYAGAGDVPVAAALVRAAAGLKLDGPWLEEALVYLLDQQQPAGCFGLLALGRSLTSTEDEITEASMRLTVEVLWALAAARYLSASPEARRDARPSLPLSGNGASRATSTRPEADGVAQTPTPSPERPREGGLHQQHI
jgi:hypothetical protein